MEIKGIEKEDSISYLGIRYASAERFSSPSFLEFKGGEFTSYKDCCPQLRTYKHIDPDQDFYTKEFRKGLSFTYSEDCLNLNVFRPKNGENLPVIIFIHGGSFAKCSANDRPFDGDEYVKRGAILVTVNYRLNAFGFISDGSIPFNLGLHDILLALRWVKRYIHLFNGDEKHVSLMGQSAGAISIQALLRKKEVRDQVYKCILLSGASTSSFPFGLKRRSSVVRFGKKIAHMGKVKKLSELKDLPTEDLFALYQKTAEKHHILAPLALGPCFEDESFFREERGEGYKKVCPRILIGTVGNDLLNNIMQSQAEKAQNQFRKAYRYVFIHPLPGDDSGTWHSCDLYYLFGFKGSWRPFTKEDEKIKDNLIDDIVTFISKGDLSNGKSGEWSLDECIYI